MRCNAAVADGHGEQSASRTLIRTLIELEQAGGGVSAVERASGGGDAQIHARGRTSTRHRAGRPGASATPAGPTARGGRTRRRAPHADAHAMLGVRAAISSLDRLEAPSHAPSNYLSFATAGCVYDVHFTHQNSMIYCNEGLIDVPFSDSGHVST